MSSLKLMWTNGDSDATPSPQDREAKWIFIPILVTIANFSTKGGHL